MKSISGFLSFLRETVEKEPWFYVGSCTVMAVLCCLVSMSSAGEAVGFFLGWLVGTLLFMYSRYIGG